MLYFDPGVQLAITEALKQVKGIEDKEDARQEAYSAIADEQPINIDDAIECAKRAIDKYRHRVIRYNSRVGSYDDDKEYADEGGRPVGSDYIPRRMSWVDYEQPDTDNPPRHGPEYFKSEYRKTLADKETESAIAKMKTWVAR